MYIIPSIIKHNSCNGSMFRYVRAMSSHEPMGTTLPKKDSLLSLVDTHILKLPSSDKANSSYKTQWPFNVFEELELLDLLRVQIEERPSIEVRLALFDSLFGLAGRNNKVRLTI